jgi:hypothetical protein
VHWGHGNVAKGFGSLGLNFGLTAGGGLLGAAVACASAGCDGEFGALAGFVGAMLGGGVGLLAANIIDVAALAYDEPKRSYEAAARARRRPSLELVPSVAVAPGQARIGLAGAY